MIKILRELCDFNSNERKEEKFYELGNGATYFLFSPSEHSTLFYVIYLSVVYK